MSKEDRFKGYVINESGPKPETTRTAIELKHIRKRREMLRKIDDKEFCKELGIFDISDQVR